MCVCAKSLCNAMDHSLLGSSVHGILQARILEWVAISFSRGSSWPRDGTLIFLFGSRFFTAEPWGSPCLLYLNIISLEENVLFFHRKKLDKALVRQEKHVCHCDSLGPRTSPQPRQCGHHLRKRQENPLKRQLLPSRPMTKSGRWQKPRSFCSWDTSFHLRSEQFK